MIKSEEKQMTDQSAIQKLSSEFSELIERASKSIVLIPGRRSAASGIAWRKDLVITADHLLGRSGDYEIRTSSGEAVVASVIGRDPSIDIAILKTGSELEPLVAGASPPLKAGQLAVSIGRASGGRILSALTMVSGTDGAYRNWRGGSFDTFIRLDLAPYPGFSGSALILADGSVAGMNTSAFSRHFGLTVPASNIERLVERVSTKGFVGKPYLGVMMQPVRLSGKLRQSGTDIGLLVIGTEEGSPAEQSGILQGDVVVRVNGKTINSMEDIHDLLSDVSIGKEITVSLLRGGQPVEITMKIGERPARHQNK
jgi:S1-C subfamily serine protease